MIDLNRTAFRRMVQLHLAVLALVLGSTVLNATVPSLVAFGDGFDALVGEHFGSAFPPDHIMWPAAITFIVALIWSIVSTIGLLWFKRWARFGNWASIGLMYAVSILAFGSRPVYSTMLENVLFFISNALFGAIILLSYASGLGAQWFARTQD